MATVNRKKVLPNGFHGMVATSKDILNKKMSALSRDPFFSTARFRGKLGAAISVITSLIVGFLTIPNNVLYFIDNRHRTRTQSDEDDYEYVYIHAGIALVTLGCLAMVVSIVLSYFAAKSKRKLDDSEDCSYADASFTKSTRTVLACLIMMNIELFMAVIAGCMEMLYRPMTSNVHRLHNVECAIAVFNIVIYLMYVITMVMTSSILKAKNERFTHDVRRENPNAFNPNREYTYNSQAGYM